MNFRYITLLLVLFTLSSLHSQTERARDFGLAFGVIPTGLNNAITDVAGVSVGHVTRIEEANIRTGVTAILPHQGNLFQDKVPAAIYVGNGFGKLMGSTQVIELGNIETPILLTNTLSVPTVADGLTDYILQLEGNEEVRSVNAVVGETNDGSLNDIRAKSITRQDVINAIQRASQGKVEEGNVGAGTGTICFGYKGGIGTASRALPGPLGGYTVGVLVQSNFGGNLVIDGIPFDQETGRYPFRRALEKGDGSCMIIVATDAPMLARNLERMAKRAIMGLAKTGGIASNGSGDYVIAFSTFEGNRITYSSREPIQEVSKLSNNAISPILMATIEATEEAIINSMIAAEDMTANGITVKALPKDLLRDLIKKYRK